MARRVRLSEPAGDDLSRIHQWLAQPGSGATAKAKLRHIARAIRELARAPLRWKKGDKPNTRERVVDGYVIVYTVESNTGEGSRSGDVTVMRIFGPGQDRSVP